MPDKIIKKFEDEYGIQKGKRIYYATANKQGRDPETFKNVAVPKARKLKNPSSRSAATKRQSRSPHAQ